MSELQSTGVGDSVTGQVQSRQSAIVEALLFLLLRRRCAVVATGAILNKR